MAGTSFYDWGTGEIITAARLNGAYDASGNLDLGGTASAALVVKAAGVVGAPAFCFNGDDDTGIYRVGANNLGIATGGSVVVDVNLTRMVVTGTVLAGYGTAGGPGLSFGDDSDTGLFRDAANSCAISAGGAAKVSFDATNTTFETYVILLNTDVDGTSEGQLWYDDSENKLKFYNGTAVETVTSAV